MILETDDRDFSFTCSIYIFSTTLIISDRCYVSIKQNSRFYLKHIDELHLLKIKSKND